MKCQYIRKVFIFNKKKLALCAPSLTDINFLEKYLQLNELYTDNIEAADAILVHTCAFTKTMEEEAISSIEYINQKRRNSAMIIVIGCLPAINKQRLQEVHTGIAISQNELNRLDEILPVRIKLSEVKYSGYDRQTVIDGIPDYPLRIGWGCLGNCSYCSIKNVFGHPRSRVIPEIIEEVKAGLKQGFTTFYLVANEISCYGHDICSDLMTLIDEIVVLDPSIKLRLSSYLPNHFKSHYQRMEKYISDNRIDYIYLACQSGSDKILKLMRRPYTINDFKYCINIIHRLNPQIQLRTDIIVGFPYESEDDFQQTLKLIIWLSQFHIRFQTIPFSVRPETIAEKMSGHLPEEVILERYKRLSLLLYQLQAVNPNLVYIGSNDEPQEQGNIFPEIAFE